jgi:hypothetical protein
MYKRTREVDPKHYKEGASYKIPIFEKKAYDVESPVKAYIHSPSPARKPRRKAKKGDQKRIGLSPASKYYLGLSQRVHPDDRDRELDEDLRHKPKFLMTATLKNAMESANPVLEDELSLDGYEFNNAGGSVDDQMKTLLKDALKSKLSIIEGYEEDVAALTRTQIHGIVRNEKLQGRIEE